MPTYHCKLDKFATRSFAALAKHYRTKHAAYMARRRSAARKKAPRPPRAPKRSRRAISESPGGSYPAGAALSASSDLECAIQTVRSHGGSVSFGTG